MKNIDFITPSLEEWLASFQFHSPIKVRFSETDAFGHVNNVSHIIYFEQARLDYFEELQVFSQFLKQDHPNFIVAADIHCHYIKQIYFNQGINIKVKTDRIGRSSLDLHYAITDADSSELLAAARGTIVHVDKKSGKSVPWPDEIRNRIIQSEQ